ncbi:MAG: acylphosphatase, partial [Firmicutes bacterium]|nr:acylphosphatase [Bacillota bacterium]
MSDLVRYHIHVSGIVQGVGFRPFVYGLARRCSLAGWVYNTSSGVFIEIEGTAAVCTAFLASLQKEAPSLSRIDRI